MPGGSEYCVFLLYDFAMIPPHMRVQSLPDVWMSKEENRDSRQGTPESVLQSYKKGTGIELPLMHCRFFHKIEPYHLNS